MATLSAEELCQKGERYLRGDGVKADIKKAAEYFEQAISLGNIPEAKRELGYILLGDGLLHTDASDLNGLSAEIKRHERGEQLIKEAAEDGDVIARKWYIRKYEVSFIVRLVLFFAHPKGATERRRNSQLARKFKNELLAEGDMEMLYEKCFGIIINDTKTMQKLADQEYAPAEYTLGAWYMEGYPLKQDLHQAKYWLTRSLEHGNQNAKKMLDKM